MLADFRHALRQLRKSPGFTLTAVMTLALGIGATTAIFTLVQQVMLQSMPVTRPDQLWRIGDQARSSQSSIGVISAARLGAKYQDAETANGPTGFYVYETLTPLRLHLNSTRAISSLAHSRMRQTNLILRDFWSSRNEFV